MSEDKELKKLSLQKNLDNGKREIEMIESHKRSTEDKYKLLLRFKDVREKMHAQAIKNYVYVRPTFAFQQDPDYIALQQEQASLEFELEQINRQGQIDQMETMLKSFDEQIASHKENMAKVEEQIKELDGE
jgi:hypothetical protein